MTGQEPNISLLSWQDLPEEVRSVFRDAGVRTAEHHGLRYQRLGDGFLACSDSRTSRLLAEALFTETHPKAADDPDAFLRRLLEGTVDEVPEEQLRRYGLLSFRHRNVILFTPLKDSGGSLLQAFRDAASTDTGDLLVRLSDGAVALVKANQDDQGEEAAEYAEAAIETMEMEYGIQLAAGIGACRNHWREIGRSCEEARRALETGRLFHRPGPVYEYRKQRLERLLTEIPPRKRQELRGEIFNPSTRKVLGPDTLQMIRAYFDNDLSVSTTSRQLFMHRNTIMYRLEKIRKATGLDLRKFSDAAAFKLWLDLPETAGE